MAGLLGLLCGIFWTYDQRVNWPIGLIIVVTSLASLYLAFTHARFKNWIEFGEHVRVRNFSGIKTYDWRDVASISYEFNMETGREAVLTLNNNDEKIEFSPSELKNIAEALSTGLQSEKPEIREAVVHGLLRLGCVECFVVTPGGSYQESYEESVAEMRKGILSRLEKVLEDSDQSVRAAAEDGLGRIRSQVARDHSGVVIA